MTAPQISIIGAGVSGLILGRCLLQRGIRAVLFEKSRPSQNRNRYGITLHTAVYRPLLTLLGIQESTFYKKVAIEAAIADTKRLEQVTASDAFRVNRSRFEAFLAEGLDIRYEHQFQSISSSSGLILEFSNGIKHNSDVVVGADGVHSQLRQHVSAETDFNIIPYAVFNGKRRMSLEDFSAKLKGSLDGRHVLEQFVDGTVFQISVDDFTHHQISISYNFSRAAKSGEDPLYRPTRSKSEATSIPEHFFSEVDTKPLTNPYDSVFDTKLMKEDRILNWLMRTLQVDRDPLDRAASRGIVLIGESVHAEPILGGHGANEAIEDGMILAEILAEDYRNLTRFYEKRYDTWTTGIRSAEKRIESMHKGSKSSL